MMKPAVKAILVKHVAAIKLPDELAISQRAQAHHAITTGSATCHPLTAATIVINFINIVVVVVFIRKGPVFIQLLGEDYEASETRSDVWAGRVILNRIDSGHAHGVEEAEEERAEVAEAVGDEGDDEEWK